MRTDMKKETIIYTVLIIVIAGLASLYVFHPREIVVTKEMEKTVTVHVKSKPDTVYIRKNFLIKSKPDTVIKTVTVEKPVVDESGNAVIPDDLTQTYVSVKRFNTLFIDGMVMALASAPVDSFDLRTEFNSEAFRDYYSAQVEQKWKWYHYAGAGLLAGVSIGLIIH